MKYKRLVIYSQDIQVITGRGVRYAQRMMRIMKKRFGKKNHQLITCEEFCEYTGISREAVERCLAKR